MVEFWIKSDGRTSQPLKSGIMYWDARPRRADPGKIADVLIVDGDPLEDISILEKRDHLKLIMKEGKIYKNTL